MIARDEVVAGLRSHLATALIVLDFDGTLSPLIPDPSKSRLVDGAREALDRLVAAGARVAIVTGRDAATVVEVSGLGDLPGLDVEGLYGLEQWFEGELSTPDEPASMARARARLPELVAAEPRAAGIWIEDKRLSLVVHARRADDPVAAIDAVRAPVGALAEQLGLEVHPGRDVLELRVPGHDKGIALRRLVARYRPSATLYVGDDVGDLPAFEVIRELRSAGEPAWAGGIISADAPEVARRADLELADPAAVAAFLAEVADPAR